MTRKNLSGCTIFLLLYARKISDMILQEIPEPRTKMINKKLDELLKTRNKASASPLQYEVIDPADDQKSCMLNTLVASIHFLSENIYSLVDQMEHTHADKVTKMILELDTAEVLYLLESPDSLKLAVEEAMNYVKIEQI
nr:polyadenylate-binding protein 8-like [Tanacetum cinerariifolium]